MMCVVGAMIILALFVNYVVCIFVVDIALLLFVIATAIFLPLAMSPFCCRCESSSS